MLGVFLPPHRSLVALTSNLLIRMEALTSYLLIKKVVALISNHIGPNPIVTSEWPTLTSDLLVRKAVALTSM